MQRASNLRRLGAQLYVFVARAQDSFVFCDRKRAFMAKKMQGFDGWLKRNVNFVTLVEAEAVFRAVVFYSVSKLIISAKNLR